MKYYLKTLLIALFLSGSTPLFADKKYEQVEKQRIEYKIQIDSLEKIESGYKQELLNLEDTIRNKYEKIQEISNKLSGQNEVRHEADSQTENQEDSLKRLKEESLSLKNKLVEMAIKFLMVPYEEYSINEVAIPDFEKGAGSEEYARNEYRGKMLKNYKNDWNKLKDFLKKHKNTTYLNAGSVKDQLLEFPTYIQYAGGIGKRESRPAARSAKKPQAPAQVQYITIDGYGDGWEKTYLGSIMYELIMVLSRASGPQSTIEIQDVFNRSLQKMK